jgi:hypothetical protein
MKLLKMIAKKGFTEDPDIHWVSLSKPGIKGQICSLSDVSPIKDFSVSQLNSIGLMNTSFQRIEL